MKRISKTILTNMCMISEGDLILVQDKQNSSYTGVTFPGGHIENNESIADSVIREVFEETGLTIKNPKLCGVFDWIYEDGVRYIVFIHKAHEFTGELKASKEGPVRWIKKDNFLNEAWADGMDKVFEIINGGKYTECYYDMKLDEEFMK